MPSVRRNRAGNWEARVYVPARGTERPTTATETYPGEISREEAEERAAAFERRARGDRSLDVTVAEFAEEYIGTLMAMGASPTALPSYRTYVRRYIAPRLGRILVCDLRPADIERMYVSLRTGPGAIGAATVRCLHAFMRGMLARAVRYGMLASSPMDAVERPRAARHEAMALDDAELAAILDATEREPGTIAAVATRLALATGMRRAEVCGLVWRSVDNASKSVTVSTIIVASPGVGLVRKEPKSRAGSRTIVLDDPSWEWLMRWRDTQRAELAGLGKEAGPSTPVLTLTGDPVAPDTVSRAFRALAVDAGVERPVTFHTLRHTHATRLLHEGVDVKTLQMRMGHSSATITLDTYAHAMPGVDVEAARAAGRALWELGA